MVASAAFAIKPYVHFGSFPHILNASTNDEMCKEIRTNCKRSSNKKRKSSESKKSNMLNLEHRVHIESRTTFVHNVYEPNVTFAIAVYIFFFVGVCVCILQVILCVSRGYYE